jgi:hypothetical protein
VHIAQGHTNRQKRWVFASWIVDAILCGKTQWLVIHEKWSWCVPGTFPNRQKRWVFASWIVDAVLCGKTQWLVIHEKWSWCVPGTFSP